MPLKPLKTLNPKAAKDPLRGIPIQLSTPSVLKFGKDLERVLAQF